MQNPLFYKIISRWSSQTITATSSIYISYIYYILSLYLYINKYIYIYFGTNGIKFCCEILLYAVAVFCTFYEYSCKLSSLITDSRECNSILNNTLDFVGSRYLEFPSYYYFSVDIFGKNVISLISENMNTSRFIKLTRHFIQFPAKHGHHNIHCLIH